MPRENAKPVMTYLYRPAGSGENLPVVFNVHGGAWVGGDALLLDTQSREMADRLGCLVVNINYVKADVKPFPYAQYEIRDTVRYFADHAKEYNLDAQRFAVMGYSAGGHLSACAAQLLQQDGIRLSCQVLCYPFLNLTFQGETDKEMKDTFAGLEAAGVRVHLLDYPESVHGFLECNYPETEDSNDAKSPRQKKICSQCENDIEQLLLEIWKQ